MPQEIEESEYKSIQGHDFTQLSVFMKKLYTLLTKRNVPDNPLGISKKFQLVQMEEKTETYLLTNKGIERLDASKELSQRDMKSLRDVSDKDKKDADQDKNKNVFKGSGFGSGGGKGASGIYGSGGGEGGDGKNRQRVEKPAQDQFQRSYSGHGNQSMVDSQHDMMMSMGGTDNKDYYAKKDENYRTINDK